MLSKQVSKLLVLFACYTLSLTSDSVVAQLSARIEPQTKENCELCCGKVFTNNPDGNNSCVHEGCGGINVEAFTDEKPCSESFADGQVGRAGCETGRDFRLAGYSYFIRNETSFQFVPCHSGNYAATTSSTFPQLPTELKLNMENCSACCRDADTKFDAVSPNDFDADSCQEYCDSQSDSCFNETNHRNRFGCSIARDFLIYGTVVLRTSERVLTCKTNGKIEASFTLFPTQSPTDFTIDEIPNGAPTVKPDNSGSKEGKNPSQKGTLTIGAAAGGLMLLLGLALYIVWRRNKSKFSGASDNAEKDKRTQDKVMNPFDADDDGKGFDLSAYVNTPSSTEQKFEKSLNGKPTTRNQTLGPLSLFGRFSESFSHSVRLPAYSFVSYRTSFATAAPRNNKNADAQKTPQV